MAQAFVCTEYLLNLCDGCNKYHPEDGGDHDQNLITHVLEHGPAICLDITCEGCNQIHFDENFLTDTLSGDNLWDFLSSNDMGLAEPFDIDDIVKQLKLDEETDEIMEYLEMDSDALEESLMVDESGNIKYLDTDN